MGQEHPLQEGRVFPGGFWVKLQKPGESPHRFHSGTEMVSFICLHTIFEELAQKCRANRLEEAAAKAQELSDIFLEKINEN